MKDFSTSYEMWIKIKAIYGGDDNVRRDKVESLREKIDQIKMREDKNIARYSDRIKLVFGQSNPQEEKLKMR